MVTATGNGVRRVGAVIGAFVLASVLSGGVTAGSGSVAHAATTSTSALSITIDSPEGAVESGDRLAYTAHLENLGVEVFAGSVVVEAPSFVSVEDAQGAEVQQNSALWEVEVDAGATTSFEFSVVIGTIPETITRVTTLVSVFGADDARPIVRTAHAAAIEGVVETPSSPAEDLAVETSEGEAAGEINWLLIALIGVVVLLAVGAGVVAFVVKRRASSSRGARRHRASTQT